MPYFRTSFPHRGWDGTDRQPGDVVLISEHEAAVRTRDGFGKIVPQPTIPEPQEAPEPAQDEPRRKPNKAASKADWEAWLLDQGVSPEKLEGMTRAEMIRLGSPP